MIKAILFDLDGTLIDTNELIIETFLYVLKGKTPKPLTREDIIPHMGKPLEEQLRHFLGKEEVAGEVDAYRVYNIQRHDELIREFPGVREAVEALKGKGLALGIVTTKRRDTALRGLKLCGLDSYMDVVITLDDVRHPKPHPEPVYKALKGLGVSPGEAMMVGDSPADILAANRAGVTSVGVAWSLKGTQELKKYGPAMMIESIDELSSIADSFRGERH